MLELLTCPRGHFWESASDAVVAEPANGSSVRTCPECGALAESMPLLEASPPPPIQARLADPEPLVDGRGFPLVAGYQVQQELGEGPTGVRYYLARQNVLNRSVLLKVVLAREDVGQQGWASLRGEANALARLKHPHIVQIHEAGERDRQLFYNATEFIDGPNLAQKVADTPLPFRQVALLMETLAHAIHYAHEEGLVHRNLKPTSVLLQPLEESKDAQGLTPPLGCTLHSHIYVPRLTDFGLARKPIEGEIADLDLFGEQGGYLAPEQAWGRARDIGPVTDVYGLGGILYFLLVGRPPFKGPTATDLIDAIQSAELVPPSAIRSVPSDLEAICRKALTRSPRRRYPNALEMARDFRRLLAGVPVQARPSSVFYSFGKWLRRQPAVAGLLAFSVVGGVTTLAAYTNSALTVEDLRRQVSQARQDANSHRRTAESAKAQLFALQQFPLYRQQIYAAARFLEEDNPHPARNALMSCPDQFRQWEWHYLWQKSLGNGETKLRDFSGPITTLTFSPPVTQPIIPGRPRSSLAVASLPEANRGRLHLWAARQGLEVKTITDFQGPIHALAFAPDGQSVVGVSANSDHGGEVKHWRVHDKPKTVFTPVAQEDGFTGVTWSNNGESIYVISRTGQLSELRATDGGLKSQFTRPAHLPFRRNQTTHVQASPDGLLLATWTLGEPDIHFYNVRVGRYSYSFSTTKSVQAFAFGPDSKSAIALADNSILIHNPNNKKEANRLTGHSNTVTRLAFNREGTRLVSASEDKTIKVWGEGGSTWIELLTLPNPGTSGVAFSHDGKALAIAHDREVTVLGVLED